ncbi:ATP-binding protein [Pseudomonas sp. B6002]|uniref:AAA family ATPase n=1 Tax=Pseudomonas sp. B6002 TaxID=2726978 RepID=UPI0015A11A9C|nr:ATP-binding protein [Pseudomonas sp. B6002]NVZ50601.1 ATP-binding protein [Pseudomonas sp. B6002]
MPTLHLLCGKIASGKSTLAKHLAAEHAAVVLSEDHWLTKLYPGEILSIADYLNRAQRIRGVLGPLVINLLQSGVNVVLDFPANTLANREWLLGLAQAAQAPHCLHYLELDDATCRARLHARNAGGEHDFAATDAEFDLITRHFCVPTEAQGLVIEVHHP